jgi:hypothetical protein
MQGENILTVPTHWQRRLEPAKIRECQLQSFVNILWFNDWLKTNSPQVFCFDQGFRSAVLCGAPRRG